MLKNCSDDSNSSDDEIIKVNNSETRIAQILFVGIILSYLVKILLTLIIFFFFRIQIL